MMRKMALILLFTVVLIGTVIMNAPLDFILDKAGAKRAGFTWTGASGNWRTGQLAGVQFAGQPIGTIKLDMQPKAVLAGQLAYDVQWQGTPGQGIGKVRVGRNSVSLVDLNAQVRLGALRYLVDEVRASGARVTVQDGQVEFVDWACAEASGEVSSDVLTRMAAPYRQDASVFTGDVACAGDMLEVFGFGSIGETGDVTSTLRIGVREISSLRAEIFGAEAGLGIALLDYGFEPSADGYMFEHSFTLLEGLQ